MAKLFLISEKDLGFIEDAIRTLRDHINARGLQTEASLDETKSVLAGLLLIYPKPEPTWPSNPGWPEGPGAA